MGTGASLIKEPFPADCGSFEPANGSPFSLNLSKAAATVRPMSKHSPVLLRKPSSCQRQYRRIWSWASKAPHSTRLVPRQSAIDVSSVHCPGRKLKGPPPTMPVRGLKLPRALNSKVVHTSSPDARSIIQTRIHILYV